MMRVVSRKTQSALWSPRYATLLAAGILSTTALFMSVPVLPKYMTDFGASYGVTGMLCGAGPLISLAARPFSGIAADRCHKKRLFMAFAALTGLTILGYSVSHALSVIAVMRVLNGAAFAVCGTAVFAMASQIIPASRMGEGVGYISLAQILASSVGPSLGLAVCDRFGYERCFQIICAVSAVSALLVLPIRCEYEKPRERLSLKALRVRDMLAVDMMPLSLLGGPFSLGNALVMTFIAMLGSDRGIQSIGVYFIINAAALIVVRPLAGKLYDRKGLTPVLLPAFLLDAAALACIALSRSFWAIAAAAVLRAVGQGAGQPSVQAECIRIMGRERSGVATSTYYTGNDIFQGLGSMIGGAVLAAHGYCTLYLVGCAVSLGGLVYFILCRRWIFRMAERSAPVRGAPAQPMRIQQERG